MIKWPPQARDQAALGLVANDEEASRSTLRDAGIAYREIPVITVRIEDKPGQTASTSRRLADAGVNIELWLPVDTTRDIYVGVTPFVVLQLIALVALFRFPQIATWLPKAIGW